MKDVNGEEAHRLIGGIYAGLKIVPVRFPGGLPIPITGHAVVETFRRVTRFIETHDLQLSDQRPPLLPLGHVLMHALKGEGFATPHGFILAEKGITPIPSWVYPRYTSSGLMVLIDVLEGPATAANATLETVTPHDVTVQIGRVRSKVHSTQDSVWREIESVEPDSTLGSIQGELGRELSASPDYAIGPLPSGSKGGLP